MGLTMRLYQPKDGGDHLPFIHRLMEVSFPTSERRSRRDFEALWASESRFLLYLLFFDEEIVGFLTLWQLEGFCFGEHFAILPEMRNRGIGRETFRLLVREIPSGMPLIFEVEPPQDEWSRRRLAFYQSLGMSILTEQYEQPSYGEGRPAIPLYLMGNESALQEQIPFYIQEIYHIVYRQSVP